MARCALVLTRTVHGFVLVAGDAYIAAAWLACPGDSDSEGSRSERREVFHKMLWLGGVMIKTLHDFKDATGKQVHCRIGIASGLVVAGSHLPHGSTLCPGSSSDARACQPRPSHTSS